MAPKARKPPRVKTRPYRHYSNEFVANALALLKANGGKLAKTARQLDMPQQTLSEWAAGNRAPSPEVQQAAEINVVQKLTGFVGYVCDLRPAADKVNLRDAAVAMGIAFDKLLLLTGQPNSIIKTTGGADGREPYDLSKLTPAQLHQLADIAAAAAGEVVEQASDLNAPVVAPWAAEPEPIDPPTAGNGTAE